MNDDQGNFEEENENLKEELREQEANYQRLVQSFEHEIALKELSISNQEKQLKELKEQHQSSQAASQAALENQQAAFEQEKREKASKMENLSLEHQKKEKDLIGLLNRREQLENAIRKREGQLEALKNEIGEERKAMAEKLDQMRTKYQELNDEYLEKKIWFEKELALQNQQNDFSYKKIDDQKKQIELLTQKYEEKACSLIF